MSSLKDKVKEMKHTDFQRKILKNVEPTPEYQKYYAKGPNALSKEEKERLANIILDNVGREGIKLPVNNDDLTSFIVATTIRIARHE